MKIVHGLSIASTEGLQVTLEKDDDEVICEVTGENFTADFALPRRQCREVRDWLNVFLND